MNYHCQLSTTKSLSLMMKGMNVKTEVLHALIDNPDQYISGVKLANEFNCSRMAICKAVASLQQEGYAIESSKRLGYKLSSRSDVLSKVSLEKDINIDGFKVFFYPEIDSTNKKAKELLISGEQTPFVVVAETQVAGRGRLGRSFSSPFGGIYFSIALSGGDVSNPDLITTSASLAVSRAMERLSGQKTDIKWVNDLYLNGKKVTGILTEGLVNIEQGGLEHVVIGIGVNLFVKPEQFPAEIQKIATSFYPDGKCPFSRSEAIAACVREVVNIQKEDFLHEYREKCFVLGKELFVHRSGCVREAKALSIDDHGHLVVQYQDDSIEALSSGEVSLKF